MLKCPLCGTALELALVSSDHQKGEDASASVTSSVEPAKKWKQFIMQSQRYVLSDEEIVKAAASLKEPERIVRYSIELLDKEGHVRQWPIKQVVRRALETKFKDRFTEYGFTAHRARDVLMALGFTVHTRY